MGIAGKLTILHAFSGGADGKAPVGGLILGTDQRFHGTTEFGGLHNRGTIFRLAPDGTFKTLYDFTGAD
jgi:uncharacterized repeat protein (TIGR03803 family)